MKIVKNDLKKYLRYNLFKNLNKDVNNLPKSTFLFVTYNRCPNKDFTKNPLVWAFQTLLVNKYYKIDEYLIIDDCSNDYTYKSIKWLEDTYKIKINYYKNPIHKELSYSRKIGLEMAKNNLVFMGDDDCLFSEYFLIGGVVTYCYLSKIFDNVAVLNLNVYEKNTYPIKTIEMKNIGKCFKDEPGFCHNFEFFPEEYISKPKWLEKDINLLMPLEIDTFKGVNLINKELIIKSGNYLDLSMWKYGYSEHIELSYKIQQNNFKIFHQADPKIYSIHLKYGGKSKDEYNKKSWSTKIKGTNFTLKELIKFSEFSRKNSGTRSSTEDFHIIEIGTFFSFYLKISDKIGIDFAKKMYKVFVIDGIVFSTTPYKTILQKDVREKLWLKGIKKGIEATEIQTGRNYCYIIDEIDNIINNI